MSHDPRELLASWSAVHAWSPEEAWRCLDLLEQLCAAIWAIHETGLVELCIRSLRAEPPDEQPDGPETASIPF